MRYSVPVARGSARPSRRTSSGKVRRSTAAAMARADAGATPVSMSSGSVSTRCHGMASQ